MLSDREATMRGVVTYCLQRESKYHYQCDVLNVLDKGWDLMIAHPPCTHLAVSGGRWFKYKRKRQRRALQFFLNLLNAPIHMICVENPVSIASSKIRRCDQVIHPWQFGHRDDKTTCLWLKNLPKLKPTNVVDVEYKTSKSGRKWTRWFLETSALPTKDGLRAKVRSRTFQGIADAMAEQWSHKTTIGFDIPEFHRCRLQGNT